MSAQHDTDSQDNSLATATLAAQTNKQWAIVAVSASFSATISGALLQIKDGTTVVWEEYVYDKFQLSVPDGLRATGGNAVSAELAASGSGGTIGKVNLAAKLV